MQQAHSSEFMRRICDQIEAQINTLLSTLSQQQPSQLSPKSLQRHLLATKASILRVITLKLPQIVAIEQKLKSIIIGIDQQLQLQKTRTKEQTAKYESLVLECDRYKMETVTMGQLYEGLLREHTELQAAIKQASEKPHNSHIEQQQQKQQNNQKQYSQQWIQTDNHSHKLLPTQTYLQLCSQLQQLREEKQLFHDQLRQSEEVIGQLQLNAKAANERIEGLLGQIGDGRRVLEDMEEREREERAMLERRVGQLEGQIEERERKIRQKQLHLIQMQSQHKQQTLNLQQKLISMETDQNSLQSALTATSSQLRSLQSQHQQLLTASSQQLHALTTLQHEHTTLQHQHQQLVEKLQSVSAIRQALEGKYVQKYQMLGRQNRDYGAKCRQLEGEVGRLKGEVERLQGEVERLYEAMEGYAGAESKWRERVRGMETRLEREARRKDRTKGELLKIKKQVQQLRLMLKSPQLTTVTLSSLLHQHLHSLTPSLQHLQSTLLQHHSQVHLRNSLLQQQVTLAQDQLLASQLANKQLGNTLLQSRNQLQLELRERELAIRALEGEREGAEGRLRGVVEALRRYQGGQGQGGQWLSGQGLSGEEGELERRVLECRHRISGVEQEYRAVLRQ